MKKAEKTS